MKKYNSIFKNVIVTMIFILTLTIINIPHSGVGQRIGSVDPFGYAQKLFDEKMYDIAIATLKQFIQDSPTDGRCAEAQYKVAEGYYALNDFKRAYEEYLTFSTRYFNAPNVEQGYVRMGECLERTNQYEEAAKRYFWGAKNFYRQPDIALTFYVKAGELYLKANDKKRARDVFEQAIKLFPNTDGEYRSCYYLGIIIWEEHQSLEALRILEQVVQKCNNISIRYDAELKLGQYYSEINNQTAALESYEKAIKDAPENSPALATAQYHAGLVLMQSGRGGEAIGRLENAARISGLSDSLRQRLLVAIGESYLAGGDANKAVNYLKDIESKITVTSVMWVLRAAQGEAARSQGNVTVAMSFYDKMLRQACMEVPPPLKIINQTINDIIEMFSRQGNPYGAAQYADYILLQTLRSNDVNHYLKVGKLYETTKSYGAAAQIYQVGYSRFPESPFADDLLISVGRCQEAEGLYEKALITYRDALAQFPGCDSEQEIREKEQILEHFYVRSNQGVVSGNRSAAISALINENRSADQMLELGRSFAQNDKDFVSALVCYHKAQALSGGRVNGNLAFGMAEAYDRLSEWAHFVKDERRASSCRDSALVLYQNAIQERVLQPDFDVARLRLSELSVEQSGGIIAAASLAQKYFSVLAKDETFHFKDAAIFRVNQSSLSAGTIPFEETIQELRKFTVSYMNSPYRSQALFLIGEAYYQHHQIAEAISGLEAYVVEYPRGQYAPRALFLQGKCYLEQNSPQDVIFTFKRLTNQFNYSVYADSAAEALADMYQRVGEKKKALDIYLELFKKYQTLPPLPSDGSMAQTAGLSMKILDLYQEMRQPQEAAFFIKQLLADKPTGSDAEPLYFRLAELYQNIGRLNEAVDKYLMLCRLYPSGTYVYRARMAVSELYVQLRDVPAAIKQLDEAASVAVTEDEKAAVISLHGVCRFQSDQLAEGTKFLDGLEKNYRRVENYANYWSRLSLELGIVYYRKMDYKKALDIFKDTYSKAEKSKYGPEAAMWVGMVLRSQSKINDALKILNDMAVRYRDDPVLPQVYKAIGTLYSSIEDFPNAVVWFKRAVDETKGKAPDREAFNKLIQSYKVIGYYDAELRALREYLELFPDSEDILNKKVEIGLALISIGSYREAIDYYYTLLPEADVDTETEIAFQLGEAYKALGLKEQAISEYLKVKFYDKSTNKLPWKSTALKRISELYEQLGYNDEAIKYLKEIIVIEGASSQFGQSAQSKIDRLQGKSY